ncbi:MAG: DUF805 domain-containing protein [Beijerinckiaceae bacterium]
MKHELQELFFSWRGRINRLAFLIRHAVLVGVLLGFWLAASVLAAAGLGFLGYLLGFAVGIAVGISSIMLSIQRWHDRNLSGHVEWLFAGGPFAIGILASLIQAPAGSVVQRALATLYLVIMLWGLIELLFMPGTKGPNDYGPDPLEE